MGARGCHIDGFYASKSMNVTGVQHYDVGRYQRKGRCVIEVLELPSVLKDCVSIEPENQLSFFR